MSNGPRRPDVLESGRDREISLRAVTLFVVGLTVLVIVSAAAMWVMSSELRELGAAADPPPSPIPEARRPVEILGPRLQEDPEAELKVMLAEEDAILHGYEWVDEASGVARIPVALAMEALAAHGSLGPAVEEASDE